MHRVRLVFCMLFILCSSRAGAQTVVKGLLRDAQSGKALSDVHVMITRGHGTSTDTTGNFVLIATPGSYNLQFSCIGYAPQRRTIQLTVDTFYLQVALEPERSSIDQVVVSANRSDQKLSQLTVSMDVLRPAAINRNHISRADELLNRSAGIEVLDGQASIRGGSGFSYGAGSRVLALIDGLPVISPDAGNIKWQYLPLENLAQVEIIKGASSVLYGSSALNGIINFRTATAGDQPLTRFYTEAGIFAAPKDNNWKWSKAPRAFYGASFSHLERRKNAVLGMALHLMEDQGYRRLNAERLARLNLQWRQESTKVKGLTYGVNLNTGLTRKTDFLLWEDADSGALKQDTATAQLLQGSFVAIDPYLSIKREGVSQEFKARIQDGRNTFPDNSSNNSDARSVYAEYQGQWNLWKTLSLTTGSSGLFSSILSEFYGDHTSRNLSLYAQAELEILKRLRVLAGLRGEHYALDGQADPLVPVFRAGANYRVADYTFLRASWGQGYRYPSIAEKFANTSIGSVSIYPSAGLQPEKGWSSELGVLQGFRAGSLSGKTDLALFYSSNSSMIEYLFGLYPDPVTGESGYGFRAVNIENSRVYGFEYECQANFLVRDVSFTGSASYTWMYPVEFNPVTGRNTDIFLKYRRKHSVQTELEVTHGILSMGLVYQFRSSMLNIDDVFVNPISREAILPGFFDYWTTHNKPYSLFDASMSVRLGPRLSISASVKNLSNTEYMGRPGDIRPPRSFSLRLNGTF